MAFKLNEVVPWGRNLDEYIRIFPVVDLDGNESSLTDKIIKNYSNRSSNEKKKYDAKLVSVPYQFQKNGNSMLKIKKIN